MKFKEDERKRMIEIRNDVFRYPGCGVYDGSEREEVLKDATLNLWEGIREDALNYFEKYRIVYPKKSTRSGDILKILIKKWVESKDQQFKTIYMIFYK